MGASIRDVARAAGVSPSTVSRVLNDKVGGVQMSAATIERIRNAAAMLHYQPNAAARSLRAGRAQTIGVIARNLLHPFIAELLRGISATCRARGYHLLLGQAEAEGWVLGDILGADRVDGVLLLGDTLPAETTAQDMERLIQTHGHVVTVSAHPSVAGELSIMVDDERGVTLALEHLVELGHRAIAYVGPHQSPWSWEDQERWHAYSRFVETQRLPCGPGYVANVCGNDLIAAQEALRDVLRAPVRPTAVVVSNDMTAIVLLKAAHTTGMRVPHDLAIMGFDDIPYAALCTPGLTTVRQPIEAMGQHAASALLDKITGVAPEVEPAAMDPGANTVVFPPTLICRESTWRYQEDSAGARPAPIPERMGSERREHRTVDEI